MVHSQEGKPWAKRSTLLRKLSIQLASAYQRSAVAGRSCGTRGKLSLATTTVAAPSGGSERPPPSQASEQAAKRSKQLKSLQHRLRPISIKLPGATSKSSDRATRLGLPEPGGLQSGGGIDEFLKESRHSDFMDDDMDIEVTPGEAEKQAAWAQQASEFIARQLEARRREAGSDGGGGRSGDLQRAPSHTLRHQRASEA